MKLKSFSGWYWEGLCLLVYLIFTGSQLFVRPVVGIADNGDFPKVLGRFDVCDPDHEKDVQAYVYPVYIISPECRWDYPVLSSEMLFVRAIKLLAEYSDRAAFRISGAGKAHLSVMVAALLILLWAIHDASPVLRFGLPPLVILVFSDVAYVAYLNSFYMDAAAMVFLLLTVALAVAWIMRPRVWIAPAFAVAGALLGLSKTPHALAALLFAGLAICFALQAFLRRDRRFASWWCASAAVLGLGVGLTLRTTPGDYRSVPLYNVIFYRILPSSENPVELLRQLGLPASDLEYTSTHSFLTQTALANPQWTHRFLDRVTYSRLAAFYLRNPDLAAQLAIDALNHDVPGIRPANMGNYQRKDGFPPYTLSRRFAWWTNLRSWSLRVAPVHVVIFYCVIGLGSLWTIRRPLSPLVMVLVAAGSVEFLSSVLLDCIETARHLFLFHVITETLILCALVALVKLLHDRASGGWLSLKRRPL